MMILFRKVFCWNLLAVHLVLLLVNPRSRQSAAEAHIQTIYHRQDSAINLRQETYIAPDLQY